MLGPTLRAGRPEIYKDNKANVMWEIFGKQMNKKDYTFPSNIIKAEIQREKIQLPHRKYGCNIELVIAIVDDGYKH